MEEWAAAVASRLAFLGRAVPAPAPALEPFLHACLDLLQQAATRRDLAPVRHVLPQLCALARTAIAGDRDDRPVNAAAAPWRELQGAPGWAAAVPGRAVWLAAMAAQVPDEQGAAAVMLVNDLAAIGPDLPRRAWRAAVEG